METNIKIFVSYKYKKKILKSNIITPIQTGRAIASEIFKEMIGDDTGDNISCLNPKYNELSGIYWAWKNYDKIGNPEKIGFMHYRRHFLFDEGKKLPKDTWIPKSSWYLFNEINKKYLKYLSDKNIKKCVAEYDCISPKPFNFKLIGHKDLAENYSKIPGQRVQDHNNTLDIAYKLFPQYKDGINEAKYTSLKRMCNMFIMTKELFFEYCNFVFKVLEELDKTIDYTNYNSQEMRVLGYCAETLTSIFISQKIKDGKYKIKEINTSFICNTDYKKESKIDIFCTKIRKTILAIQ